VKLIVLLAAILLVGCGTETRTDVRVEKRTVTISRTVQQILAPNGDIVKLESVTKTVADENGQQIGSEEVTVRPPEVVGKLASLVGTGVSLATGVPAAGAAAEKAVDWLTTLITGGSLAATTAGTGYVAMRRKTAIDEANRRVREVERHRDQLIDSVETARDELSDDEDEKFVKVLGVKQDKDLQDYIQQRTKA
jgi:hypothetical protein